MTNFFHDQDILEAIVELESTSREIRISTLFQKLKDLNLITYEVTDYTHLAVKLFEMKAKGLVTWENDYNYKNGKKFIGANEKIYRRTG
jgi:hypothetical protein